ncbi:MAG: peptide chain release factor N(5)-glutamine methyltransferase [Alphaproteobacteria bacterium]|nr:peptide chain release factor N(5)-glutamine methyltransferase [Alphaproteobacteria bacterium]
MIAAHALADVSGIRGATVEQARRVLAQTFREAGLDSPDLDARLLVGHALALDRTGLAVDAARRLDGAEAQRIGALAARRLAREPVAYIMGIKEFWGLPLRVSRATLVPRPETETVVEAALAAVGGRRERTLRIADICTGSGAILLALLSELPNATGIGTDISADALAVAQSNADALGLGSRAQFKVSNYAAALTGPFDLIVSNPPYIASADIDGLAPEVRCEPRLALDGGTDGLEGYRAIARSARGLLATDGRLVVELGAGQEAAVASLFKSAGLAPEPARTDLMGIPRALPAGVALLTP